MGLSSTLGKVAKKTRACRFGGARYQTSGLLLWAAGSTSSTADAPGEDSGRRTRGLGNTR
jgi:hypothetical protein